MYLARNLIVAAVIVGSVAPMRAQMASTSMISVPPSASVPPVIPASLRIDREALKRLQPQQPASSALHPAAKGALVGAALGAGAWGGIGLWYCTIGPNEVGECGVGQWVPGFLVWGGIGAGIGALIGALR
jgi:hypothetical protein